MAMISCPHAALVFINPRTAELFQLTFAAKGGGGLLQPPLDFGLPDRMSS